MVSPVSLDFPAGQVACYSWVPAPHTHANSPALVPASLENLSPELAHPFLCFHRSPVQKAPSKYVWPCQLSHHLPCSVPTSHQQLWTSWMVGPAPSTSYPTEFIARPLHNTYCPELQGWRLFQSVSLSPGRLASAGSCPFSFAVFASWLLSHIACRSAFRPFLLTFPFLCKKPLWEGVAGREFPGRAEPELSCRPSWRSGGTWTGRALASSQRRSNN